MEKHAIHPSSRFASGRYVVKCRDSEGVQVLGSFRRLDQALSEILDVISNALTGVEVSSADWSRNHRRFRATCEIDGGSQEFRAWIAKARSSKE